MTRLLFSITLLMSIFYTCHLMAVEGSYQDAQEVRGSTDKILTSPEFRHLRGFIKSKSSYSRNSSGSQGTGSGSGEGSGNGSEGSGKGGSSKGSTTDEQSGSDSNSDSEPFSSSGSSSSMSGGLGGGLGTLVSIFFWAIITVVAIAMLYFIVRALLDRDTSTKTEDVSLPQESQEEEPEQAPGEIPADVYITRARELAAQGLYNEAVAQLLLGAMSNIERAGLIQYRKGLTNRDYLRVIRSNKGPYQAFNLIVRTYEPIGFGRRSANEAHFEKSLAGYEQGFRASL